MEYVFYETFPGVAVDRICAALLEKVFGTGARAVVFSPFIERVRALDSLLWTFRPGSFVPHGSSESASQPTVQPIWLTDRQENPNNAQILMLVDFCEALGDADITMLGFSKVIYIASGSDADGPCKLKSLCDGISEPDSAVFWRQGKNGDWQKGEICCKNTESVKQGKERQCAR
ncbi:MAG: DNA polymerase III subunit chi [Holosporales bacterium]|nr:DNA polymerase III subunit chi [Holosporales bacterium]